MFSTPASVMDNSLCIGEAKSNGDLKANGQSAAKVAKRYRNLANDIGATTVVFATTQNSWDAGSIAAIDAAFADLYYVKVHKPPQ
jgi:hypothetical protein